MFKTHYQSSALLRIREILCIFCLFFATGAQSATSEVEPNDSKATAQPIALPDSIAGTLQKKSPADVDYYAFTLPAAANVTIGGKTLAIGSSNVWWRVSVYRSSDDAEVLYLTFDQSAPAGTTRQLGLPAGQYYLKLSDGAYASDVPYLLSLSTAGGSFEVELNDSKALAQVVPLPGSVTGALQRRSGTADVDYYAFTLPAAANVTIGGKTLAIGSSNVWWRVSVYRSSDDAEVLYLTFDQSAPAGTTRQLGLPAGQYYLKLSDGAYASDVPYLLTLSNGSLPIFDLNQHGLSGSWYEPLTAGQGFEIEVFPNIDGPGKGRAQLSWFTYDVASGGADRQRWYTLSGSMVTGTASASMTIYQNTGGNFVSLPATTAHAVGAATLSFNDCDDGQLVYSFSDGSGRSGAIPLSRLTGNVTCSLQAMALTNTTFALSGNWYDPSFPGQGITVDINPTSSVAFLAWYTYAPNGASAGASGQRWYTGQGPIASGVRTMNIDLFETTGGVFDTPSHGSVTTKVGMGSLTFLSCTSLRYEYSFTSGENAGLGGRVDFVRVGPTPPGCAN